MSRQKATISRTSAAVPKQKDSLRRLKTLGEQKFPLAGGVSPTHLGGSEVCWSDETFLQNQCQQLWCPAVQSARCPSHCCGQQPSGAVDMLHVWLQSGVGHKGFDRSLEVDAGGVSAWQQGVTVGALLQAGMCCKGACRISIQQQGFDRSLLLDAGGMLAGHRGETLIEGHVGP